MSILEHRVDSIFFHSQQGLNYLNRRGAKNRNRFDFGYIHETDSSKSKCLVANLSKGLPFNTLINNCKNPPTNISDGLCRKLTPLECERLQTVPEGYTLVLNNNGKQQISNTQRYKMLGNGWTVDVITHLLKGFL
ncbi:DNA cytosine methyltransferase [Aliivibrio salmonicida]|uniref:DNA cytosine methyltransferase n=1 Tax=Aliivibrio salmonicida TaxID=40269 RepID=UPI003D13B202